jgi:hypothetical protein
MFQHWHVLLPFPVCGKAEAREEYQVRWRHVVDERIPSMSYVNIGMPGPENESEEARNIRHAAAAADFNSISRGDWMRLCFADPAGGDPLPYDGEFLEGFEQNHCYDRFFSQGTRQMFSGYAHVSVGSGGFFSEIYIHHFRRLYFQMALLSHFENAALLCYSNWLSEAVHTFRDDLRGDAFRKAILAIEEEMVNYIHHYRFTGVTSQLQGREMYDFWRKSLHLDQLFDDLRTESRDASEFLLAQEEARQADAANNLASIAAVAAALGLPMAFLGMNVIVQQKFDRLSTDLGVYFGLTTLFTFFTLFLAYWVFSRDSHRLRHFRILRIILSLIMAFTAVISLVSLMMA